MQPNAVSDAEQRTVARVAGAVAHELNNPLQGILSLLTVTLRDCRLDERCQLRLEQIHHGVSRMSRTVATLAAIYENLPRPPDFFSPAQLLDCFASELAERALEPHVLVPEGAPLAVVCFASELAKLSGDVLVENMNGHNLVHLLAASHPYGMEVRFEFGSPPAYSHEWAPIEQTRGISGIAVLLDEVIKLSRGAVEFRMGDARLDGMRFFLRTA